MQIRGRARFDWPFPDVYVCIFYGSMEAWRRKVNFNYAVKRIARAANKAFAQKF